jgi:hypothetical protein
MNDSIGTSVRIASAVAMATIMSHGPIAWAGWTGSMNGTGYGKASGNVTSSTLKSNAANSAVMNLPSAAIKTTAGYSAGASLPNGASASTYSRIKGQAGYVWTASTVASNGDKTDNSELAGSVTATSRVACTTLEVLLVTIETNSPSCSAGEALYTFTWHWTGTDAGTAQQVKWYEYYGELPTDSDFNGDVGSLPGAELLGQRAQTFGEAPIGCEFECDPVFDETVSRTICATNDPNFVYMVTDGIAVSLPCPLSFAGFLPPIGGADATGGTCTNAVRGFKLGSTIPVKMNLQDCDGLPVVTGDHTIQVSKCDSTAGGEAAIDATPTDAATDGNLFRLTDPATGQWHFNLGTKSLAKGTWKIIVTLADGSVHFVYVDLKR